MQFVDIEKKDGGAYLHRYDLHYIDRTGCPRTYEMVSRDRNIDSLAHLQQHRTDAVVMVLTDAKRERMALNHEFRMELGQRIYGLPGRTHRAGRNARGGRAPRAGRGNGAAAGRHHARAAAGGVHGRHRRRAHGVPVRHRRGNVPSEQRPHGGDRIRLVHARTGARPARDGPVRLVGAGIQLDVRQRLSAGSLREVHHVLHRDLLPRRRRF